MRSKWFLCVLLMSMGLSSFAQKGLNIQSLFGEEYKRRSDATEIYLSDKRKLSKFKLDLFRSLSIVPTAADMQQIEKVVSADMASAKVNEGGRKRGRLFYVFFTLPPVNGNYRYVFYRNNALYPGSDGKLTLVYMEGKASYDELKRIFKY